MYDLDILQIPVRWNRIFSGCSPSMCTSLATFRARARNGTTGPSLLAGMEMELAYQFDVCRGVTGGRVELYSVCLCYRLPF